MPNFIIIAVYADGLAPLCATLSASTLMSNFVSIISIKWWLDGKNYCCCYRCRYPGQHGPLHCSYWPQCGPQSRDDILFDTDHNIRYCGKCWHQTNTHMATNVSISHLQWIWDWFDCKSGSYINFGCRMVIQFTKILWKKFCLNLERIFFTPLIVTVTYHIFEWNF